MKVNCSALTTSAIKVHCRWLLVSKILFSLNDYRSSLAYGNCMWSKPGFSVRFFCCVYVFSDVKWSERILPSAIVFLLSVQMATKICLHIVGSILKLESNFVDFQFWHMWIEFIVNILMKEVCVTEHKKRWKNSFEKKQPKREKNKSEIT